MTKLTKDYTMGKHPDFLNIIRCPKCGRLGELRHYPNEKFDLVIHKKELYGIFWEVTDSCDIRKDQSK